MRRRGSGVLLHISSLPSRFGIGDLGLNAYRFADRLAESKQTYWQILPLTPTNLLYDNSPYHSMSAFAGNPLLISPERLVDDGLLEPSELEPVPDFPADRVDYEKVTEYKKRCIDLAYERSTDLRKSPEYVRFCKEQAYWLDDFVLFKAVKEYHGGAAWNEWKPDIREREPDALKLWKSKLLDNVQKEYFIQFLFFTQWFDLKKYCNDKGIQIIGDVPIYVEYDSVELWSDPTLFKLDENKKPYVVAGVPPDYFSKTGQLWGNPVYDWDVMQQRSYTWWVERIGHTLHMVDIVRIDHFRGLVAYWEVPAGEDTAINGSWVDVPVDDFFNTLLKRFPLLPVIAEDLGLITPDVRETIATYDLPGMKVLLFAFGDDTATNPYIPHNHVRNAIIYTGTHDNNTVKGWFDTEATDDEKARLFDYVGRTVTAEDIHKTFVGLAMMSVANTAIVPVQDILGLGADARMNTPATQRGNWRWRISAGMLDDTNAFEWLGKLTKVYGRA